MPSARNESVEVTERSGVASIAKAMSILRLVGGASAPQTVSEIAREAKLTPSSCHDLVTTLVQLGMLQPSLAGKSYEIGPRLVRFAKSALTPRGNMPAIQAEMRPISDKYGINISIFRRFGKFHYISTQVSESHVPIRIRLSAGQEFPIFRGAPGRLFAAYAEWEWRDYKTSLEAIGVSSDEGIWRFQRGVAADKERGWAVDRGQTQPGVATLSAPLLLPTGAFVGAVDLVMFQSQFDRIALEELADDAVTLGHKLGPII